MKSLTRLFFSALFLSLLVGCATTPPPPPEPKGPLIHINHYHPVTGEVLNNA